MRVASQSPQHGSERLSEPPATMDYLPVFLRLKERPVLVVGGGPVAARKVSWLLKAGAQPQVVARALETSLAQAAQRGELQHIATEFAPAQLHGTVAVVAATDDRILNGAVAHAARAHGVPVNVVDDAELSTFIFPAIIERDPLLIAVSSSGRAPVLARRIRAQIEALLPARLGALARFMGARRARIGQTLVPRARRAFWERIVQGPVGREVLAGDEDAAERTFARELRAAQLTPDVALGEVYLIGAGPGDADLLTLRGLQLLQQADVILYDRLVNPLLLERARRDAERIFVGKESGERGQQERIHALLLSLAGAGKRVARLKGGDPLVFGRGGEEIELLAAHDIPFQVVPGITAALGAAASSALPLTHRRLACSVTFVSGHDEPAAPSDWSYFANPQHTVVFYMAVAQLSAIVAHLRAAGAAAEHPAALIERATLPGQRLLRAPLAAIAERALAAQIAPPALLIVGAVAGLPTAELLSAVELRAPAQALPA
jgi:uroporphyrin-III C-methyltransferase / precorrin-2 dehydrogenase / sirohydrochlorin ferrochelatase